MQESRTGSWPWTRAAVHYGHLKTYARWCLMSMFPNCPFSKRNVCVPSSLYCSSGYGATHLHHSKWDLSSVPQLFFIVCQRGRGGNLTLELHTFSFLNKWNGIAWQGANWTITFSSIKRGCLFLSTVLIHRFHPHFIDVSSSIKTASGSAFAVGSIFFFC